MFEHIGPEDRYQIYSFEGLTNGCSDRRVAPRNRDGIDRNSRQELNGFFASTKKDLRPR